MPYHHHPRTQEQIVTDEEAYALAQQHRGVWWDRRGRKFVAEIYISGKRKSLGSHLRIESAVAAFEQANAERPPRTRKRKAGSFAQVFAEFKAECEYSTEDRAGAWPDPGQQMTYDGQAFVTSGVRTYRTVNKTTVPVVEWRADCLECGEEFECYVPLSEEAARGIVRRCPVHRVPRITKAGRASKAATEFRLPAPSAKHEMVGDFPKAGVEALPKVCQTLAMAHSEMAFGEFTAAGVRLSGVYARWVTLLEAHPQPGVVVDRSVEGGIIRFTG